MSAGSFFITLPFTTAKSYKGILCREGCYFVLLFQLFTSQKRTVPKVPLYLKISFRFAEIESNSTITAHPTGVIEGQLQKQLVRQLYVFTRSLKVTHREKVPKPLQTQFAKDPRKRYDEVLKDES